MEQKEIFKPGPLYNKRFAIVETVKRDMKSGDILYRYSDAKGPLNLPFTRIVANITKSEYSHAAILLVENGNPYVLEINDQGTLRYRLLDWIDTCYGDNFSIYRLKDLDDEQELKLSLEIQAILEKDPDYDFTFEDPDKFYCTESVIVIYERALGIKLDDGYFIKDLVPYWMYILLRAGSYLFSFFGTSLPFNERLFFVGNNERGMMSSELTKLVVKI
jgi:hypothetical protein